MKDMTLRNRMLVIAISVIMGLFAVSSFAQFGGGEGTEANPWQIETAAHLNNIRNYLGEQNNNKHFVQTADIDLGNAPWNEGTGWSPIGLNAANSFRGKYDGNGHIVANLMINNPNASNLSLFGWIVGATITDLGLKNINVTGQTRAAGLVSYQDFGAIVERCYVTGDVFGFNEAGGLVARMQDPASIIKDCYSVANITRTAAGMMEVQAPVAGGLMGVMNNGHCSRCYSIGRVATHESNLINAVIGSKVAGFIEDIYWNTETCNQGVGIGRVDGFPGNTTEEMIRQVTYSGFDFEDVWGIINNFSYPYLRWQEGPDQQNISGPKNLVGLASDRRMDLSWERPPMETEPLGYNLYIDDVLYNEELIRETNYRVDDITNWDFKVYNVTAAFEIGESSYSNEFRGSAVNFAGGRGTEESPYLVETAEQLNGVRYAIDSHFRQNADIDLDVAPYNTDLGWDPLGDEEYKFAGVYDGGHYKISNLMINRDTTDRTVARQGLFGSILEATLKNIRLVNADVTAAMFTGMLAGFVDQSNIIRCSAEGDVLGSSLVGGLVGRCVNATRIEQCYVAGSVSSTSMPNGGVAGQLNDASVVTNCYSTAIQLGSQYQIGGIVGVSTASIVTYSYATGWIDTLNPVRDIGGVVGNETNSNIDGCYWNVESTCQSESAGGEGKTTEQMVRQGTFMNWNFDEIWQINDGETYPYFRWQGGVKPFNRPAPINVVLLPDFNQEEIILTWEMIGNPVRYDIFRNGEPAGSVNHPTRRWVDTRCELYEYYDYCVQAVYIIDDEEQLTPYSQTVTGILVSPYAGGSGTEEDPLQVATVVQLANIKYLLNMHFIQVADIDLNVAPYNTGDGWLPIGSDATGNKFTGSYNGDEFAISNLFINSNGNHIGLFGYIENGVFENIKLVNVNVTGVSNVGGLVAFQNNSMIINCSVSGRLTSTAPTASRLGGLIGQKSGGTPTTCAVINCSSTATVTGANNTGGLIGDSNNGLITNCWASGDVIGRDYTGGLIGYNRDEIRQSFALGNVTAVAGRNYAGGLVGVTTGNIDCSYARGAVSSGSYVGGLAGRNTAAAITGCYSTGRVNGGANTGGLVGSNTGQVDDICYWDTETSNMAISDGGSGRRSRQMCYPYDELTYVRWDFEEVWAHDFGNINDGYPIFRYQYVRLDVPEVEIQIVDREGTDYIRITWEAVEEARSYKVYSTSDPVAIDWGEPTVVTETQFEEPINAKNKFYRVVASLREE